MKEELLTYLISSYPGQIGHLGDKIRFKESKLCQNCFAFLLKGGYSKKNEFALLSIFVPVRVNTFFRRKVLVVTGSHKNCLPCKN